MRLNFVKYLTNISWTMATRKSVQLESISREKGLELLLMILFIITPNVLVPLQKFHQNYVKFAFFKCYKL